MVLIAYETFELTNTPSLIALIHAIITRQNSSILQGHNRISASISPRDALMRCLLEADARHTPTRGVQSLFDFSRIRRLFFISAIFLHIYELYFDLPVRISSLLCQFLEIYSNFLVDLKWSYFITRKWALNLMSRPLMASRRPRGWFFFVYIFFVCLTPYFNWFWVSINWSLTASMFDIHGSFVFPKLNWVLELLCYEIAAV